jgi:hypothetical protein
LFIVLLNLPYKLTFRINLKKNNLSYNGYICPKIKKYFLPFACLKTWLKAYTTFTQQVHFNHMQLINDFYVLFTYHETIYGLNLEIPTIVSHIATLYSPDQTLYHQRIGKTAPAPLFFGHFWSKIVQKLQDLFAHLNPQNPLNSIEPPYIY